MILTYLKVERYKKNLTQNELAKELGVSRSYITAMETLRETPGEKVALKLEEYFNKPISHLLKKVEM